MDLFAALGTWWCAAGDRSATLEISSLDNPGWLIRCEGATKPSALTSGHGYRRSEHDWIEVGVTGNTLTLMSGPTNLNEMLFRFLQLVDGWRLLEGNPVQSIPIHFHSYSQEGNLDLSIRLVRWFLWQCDYDWEHREGIVIRTVADGSWQLKIESDLDDPLTVADYRVLYWPEQPAGIEIWKEGSILTAECTPPNFASMLARCLEWLEGDWRD